MGKDRLTLNASLLGVFEFEDKNKEKLEGRYSGDEIFYVKCPMEKKHCLYHLKFLGDEENKKFYNGLSDILHEFLQEAVLSYHHVKRKFPEEFSIIVETPK